MVAEAKDKLEATSVVNNVFLMSYLKDARTEVHIHDLHGRFLKSVDLPGIGTATGFGGKSKDKETFYAFTSFISATTIYRFDPAADKSSVFRQPKVDFDASHTKPSRCSTTAKTVRACRCS